MAKKTAQEEAVAKFPDFVDAVDKLSVAELEKRLVGYAKEQENVNEELSENKAIIDVSEKLKEMKGPFNDTKKALKVKLRYVMHLIKEKGGVA